jgi:hypothetical protein
MIAVMIYSTVLVVLVHGVSSPILGACISIDYRHDAAIQSLE